MDLVFIFDKNRYTYCCLTTSVYQQTHVDCKVDFCCCCCDYHQYINIILFLTCYPHPTLFATPTCACVRAHTNTHILKKFNTCYIPIINCIKYFPLFFSALLLHNIMLVTFCDKYHIHNM